MEREEILQAYTKEKDPNVKDRLMLNIRVRFEDFSIVAARKIRSPSHENCKFCNIIITLSRLTVSNWIRRVDSKGKDPGRAAPYCDSRRRAQAAGVRSRVHTGRQRKEAGKGRPEGEGPHRKVQDPSVPGPEEGAQHSLDIKRPEDSLLDGPGRFCGCATGGWEAGST